MAGELTPNLVVVGGLCFVDGAFVRADVGVAGDRIVAIGEIVERGGATVVDASGAYVFPGLIDMHTHVNWGSARLGINPDKVAAISGVTTWVDAGTTGGATLEGMLRHVVDRSVVDVITFLNMSYIGLTPAGMLTREIGELWEPAFADLRAVYRAAGEYPGVIRGLKVRASSNGLGNNAAIVLPQAREAANELGVPLMIHVGMAPPTLDEVMPFLGPGDILTHCFHPHAGGRILDGNGLVKQSVRDGVERGVLLDVGHGVASISHDVAARAIDQGYAPHLISSDIHAENVGGPVKSLLTVVEKFMAFGLTVEESFVRVTSAPAAALSRPDLGSLAIGVAADIAVISVAESSAVRQDSTGHRLTLDHELRHRVTIKGGRIMVPFDDGRQEFRDSGWLTRFGATPDDE